MKQSILQSGMMVTLATLASSVLSPAQTHRSLAALDMGTLSGVIRDSDGVPQMGALVEAILPDSGLVASAVTDVRGRYRIYLRPGKYRIQVSAAMLMPAVRERLVLLRGGRTIADMTLATLLAPSGWLPATRRSASEPSDDWTWTLRSSASRPILRYADDKTEMDEEGKPLVISSSRQESRRDATSGTVTLKSSDGGFARGGMHQVLMLTQVNDHGSGAVLRADLSGPRTPYPVAPSAEISVGFQRRTILNGSMRTVVSYAGHPELTAGVRNSGLQGAVLRSGERMELGDAIRVDAGSVVREANFGGNAMVVEPFLRVQSQGPGGLIFAYSMTHARGTESLDDLDRVQSAVPVAVMRKGHLRLETGSHQALSISGKIRGDGVIEVALYRDTFQNPLIAGIGTFSAATLPADGFIADPTTGTYRVAGRDYGSQGVRASYRQPVTHNLSVGAEFVSGSALRAQSLKHDSLDDLLTDLSPAQTYAATAFVDGKILRTGTRVRASYRRQPTRTLTAVDAYRMAEDGGYFSCTLRQSLQRLPGLPRGLEAIVDLQNLLAEGYQPYLSGDGRTLYLAQTPRALQAGLSFTF